MRPIAKHQPNNRSDRCIKLALLVPKRHACFNSSESALVILKLPIHENVFDALREFRWMVVRGFVRNCGGIEDRYVREKSCLEQASIAETFALCGKRGDPSNRLLEW